MLWFKILLIVLLAGEVIVAIAQAGGWQPKSKGPAIYALVAVTWTLVIVGVWAWL